MDQFLDRGSIIVIVLTFILFVVALFVKGVGQELLLEAGVLLVSVKLIMMAHKNNLYAEWLKKEIEELKKSIEN